jgi:predicted RNA-binding Zn-ribbon protein involved in translation (DUF1610 family)
MILSYLGKAIKAEAPMETDSVRLLEDEKGLYNDLMINLIIVWILEELDNALSKRIGASIVLIKIYEKEKEIYVDILDDGIGINTTEMTEVLKLHGNTSNRKVGFIEFRGMGGKLALSIGARIWEKISKTQQFKGVVGRAFPKESDCNKEFKTIIYELGTDDPIPTETGTLTRAIFPNKVIKDICGELELTEIIRAIQRYQESTLIGGVKKDEKIPISIQLNDENPVTVCPRYSHPSEMTNHRIRTVNKTEYAPADVLITYSEEGYGDDAGIFMNVGGRMIEQYTDWFGLQFDGNARNKIRVLVFADKLINFVENGKARLNRYKQKSKEYKEFKKSIVSELRPFLKLLDIQIFDQELVGDATDISHIEQMINKDIAKLNIKSDNNDGEGSGTSIVPDNLPKRKCPNCGKTNLKEDPNDETKYICRDCGHNFDKRWTKKPKGGIHIWLRAQGDDINKNYPFINGKDEYNLPALYNDEMKLVYINISIEPYKRADKLVQDVRNYYIYYISLEAVLNERTVNDAKETSRLMNEIFNYKK